MHGVTFDGENIWFASGDKINALDPESGMPVRSIDVAAHAGTAFDGKHLFQIAEDRIQKIDPTSGRVLATIPAPGGAAIPALPGQRVPCGSGSIAADGSIRSIPRPVRSCALSSPSAS